MLRISAMSWMWVLALGAVAVAQTPGEFPYVGEVTANDVNARSGPDTNYYPTMRLQAGARVTVTGEKFGWLRVEPPPGSFCLIAKEFVELDRNGSGVVSGDNVNVRAGSELSDRRLPITQLSKGTTVRILGDHPDGFYKIAPPKGAYVWISKQFIQRVARPEATTRPALTRPAPPGPAMVKPAPTTKPAVRKPVEPTPATKPVSKRYQTLLDKVEADLKQETADKPLRQWKLDPFLPRYQQIADQDEEEVPKLFARERLKILRDRIEVQQSLKRVQQQQEQLTDEQRVTLQQRTALQKTMRSVIEPFDAEGEIRKSWVFANRCRLVDPATDQTVAYVEAAGDGPDPTKMLGRYVGIRAGRKYSENALWVLVPSEVVVLQRPVAAPTGEGGVSTRPAEAIEEE
ncbi:MAG TPA: SH3 domain-containing protein [Phycisphaerae bacterium]|nr:SH3 domain-containing protein [Phycisphaerae bacterium]